MSRENERKEAKAEDQLVNYFDRFLKQHSTILEAINHLFKRVEKIEKKIGLH